MGRETAKSACCILQSTCNSQLDSCYIADGVDRACSRLWSGIQSMGLLPKVVVPRKVIQAQRILVSRSFASKGAAVDKQLARIRNVGIMAHIDAGKTTVRSDGWTACAGLTADASKGHRKNALLCRRHEKVKRLIFVLGVNSPWQVRGGARRGHDHGLHGPGKRAALATPEVSRGCIGTREGNHHSSGVHYIQVERFEKGVGRVQGGDWGRGGKRFMAMDRLQHQPHRYPWTCRLHHGGCSSSASGRPPSRALSRWRGACVCWTGQWPCSMALQGWRLR
eukprot:762488-Hanusia_phi.AAC.3